MTTLVSSAFPCLIRMYCFLLTCGTVLSVLSFDSVSSRANIHPVQHSNFAPRVLPSNSHSLYPLPIQHSISSIPYLSESTMDLPHRLRGTGNNLPHPSFTSRPFIRLQAISSSQRWRSSYPRAYGSEEIPWRPCSRYLEHCRLIGALRTNATV
ncbi:hypothetical protein BDW22DRAFT_853276 [Trametopsis cervina]|nr:hypothetical protein BDW22DRAFT_853276 [Trametopsis cervina]